NVVAQAIAGDSLYCGDVIEIGEEGSASLTFADGTRFQLYASTRMVVDNFVGGAHSAAGSALIRIVKGMFAVVAGKLASAGRLVIETPLGTIRSRGPAAGFGSLALGFLTFSLIKELQAQGGGATPDVPSGPHHTFINNDDFKGKLTWVAANANDFLHGTFSIDTIFNEHFEHGDATQSLVIYRDGRHEYIPTTAGIQVAYLDARRVQEDFRNDAWGQQQKNLRADLNSTGQSGSSTSDTILGRGSGGGNNNGRGPPNLITIPTGSGSSGGTGGTGTGTGSIFIPPPQPPTVQPLTIIGLTDTAIFDHFP